MEFDGVPAYATGDLLEPHPTIPGLWRYVCRISDQETMGVGPKVCFQIVTDSYLLLLMKIFELSGERRSVW